MKEQGERPSDLRPLWLVPNPEPLAAYFRPHGRDLTNLGELVAAGHRLGAGLIIDGRHAARATDLVRTLRESNHAIVLDSMGPEIFSPGGYSQTGISDLPWAPRRVTAARPLTDAEIRRTAEELAREAMNLGVTAVLTPTTYHAHTPLDHLTRDAELADALRRALDDGGGRLMAIYYPVVATLSLLSAETARARFAASLRLLAVRGTVDSVWIRLAGYDAERRSPSSLRNYVNAVRGFHVTGLPIVAERGGIVALAALALGAVGSVASAVTVGEAYDARQLQKKPSGSGRLPPHRVYLPEAGAFINAKDAAAFLGHRSIKNWFACQRACCSDGIADMIAQPRRHFIVSRTTEVDDLSRIPGGRRSVHFSKRWLGPAVEHAKQAGKVHARLKEHAERIDALNATYTAILAEDSVISPTRSRTLSDVRAIRPKTQSMSGIAQREEKAEWLRP